MNDNMKLWNKVFHTDPAHTKEVKFGRKFTSIDPMYQIRSATEVFGPVGQGWTYKCEYHYHDTLIICELIISWMPEDGKPCTYGPVAGAEEYKTHEKDQAKKLKYHPDGSPIYRIDTDAPKKAMTDALTKALSHLGFNADVFLGMFDDQKYVNSMRNEFREKEQESKTANQMAADKEWSDALLTRITAASSTELDEIKNEVKAASGKRNKGLIMSLVAAVKKAEAKFNQEENQ